MLTWVLGCDGLLGRSMQICLKKKEIPFIATNRHTADITQFEHLKNFTEKYKPTQIINCSAFNHVDQAESHPQLAYAVNATGPENLGILAARFNMQVVHISTDYVFDGQKKSPYLENDRCAPKNVYGKSKRDGEEKLLSVLPSACVVRTSWLFGKGGINFISKLPLLFQNQEEVEVDDTCIGRPTFCMDLSEALLELLPRSGIFHYAGGKPSSRYEIAAEALEMAHILKLPIKCRAIKPITKGVFTAPRPIYSALDTSYVESILKYRQRPWKNALEEFLKNG